MWSTERGPGFQCSEWGGDAAEASFLGLPKGGAQEGGAHEQQRNGRKSRSLVMLVAGH
jgi:hypothetical protein